MRLQAVNRGAAIAGRGEYETACPLICKAIAKIDSGDLPSEYARDLQVFRHVLVDLAQESRHLNDHLAPLKSDFAAALERSTWFSKDAFSKVCRFDTKEDFILNDELQQELDRNLEGLLRFGLPGLFRGIDGNVYHNYQHCQSMAQRTLRYLNDFGVQLPVPEMQALKIGLVGHDGAHSGVLGPGDLEHNVQYAVKFLYLFMSYYGFSKRQIRFAVEKGVFPTVSFNSEFVPQDAIGAAAELGDLAFEIELPHFLTNSLNVLKEQIPTIIPPPESIADWLRGPIRDGFIGTYLESRVAELEKIPGVNPDTFRRLKMWMAGVQIDVSEIAEHEAGNLPLPEKFDFFTPIKEQALETLRTQMKEIGRETVI